MKTKLTVKEINDRYIKSLSKEKTQPLIDPQDEHTINQFYDIHPELKTNNECQRNEPWIQTYTGKRFTPTNPKMEDIDIVDIAHALSQICRYTGHSSRFYSVAEHSVLVSYLGDPKYGLLHDASEAYICDIASPLKKLPEFELYRKIEDSLQKSILTKFGLSHSLPESTKKADLLMLSTEAHYLLNVRDDWKFDYNPLPFSVKCLEPEKAERLFLDRFSELFYNKSF